VVGVAAQPDWPSDPGSVTVKMMMLVKVKMMIQKKVTGAYRHRQSAALLVPGSRCLPAVAVEAFASHLLMSTATATATRATVVPRLVVAA
jgi:hypothetical protein